MTVPPTAQAASSSSTSTSHLPSWPRLATHRCWPTSHSRLPRASTRSSAAGTSSRRRGYHFDATPFLPWLKPSITIETPAKGRGLCSSMTVHGHSGTASARAPFSAPLAGADGEHVFLRFLGVVSVGVLGLAEDGCHSASARVLDVLGVVIVGVLAGADGEHVFLMFLMFLMPPIVGILGLVAAGLGANR